MALKVPDKLNGLNEVPGAAQSLVDGGIVMAEKMGNDIKNSLSGGKNAATGVIGGTIGLVADSANFGIKAVTRTAKWAGDFAQERPGLAIAALALILFKPITNLAKKIKNFFTGQREDMAFQTQVLQEDTAALQDKFALQQQRQMERAAAIAPFAASNPSGNHRSTVQGGGLSPSVPR